MDSEAEKICAVNFEYDSTLSYLLVSGSFDLNSDQMQLNLPLVLILSFGLSKSTTKRCGCKGVIN